MSEARGCLSSSRSSIASLLFAFAGSRVWIASSLCQPLFPRSGPPPPCARTSRTSATVRPLHSETETCRCTCFIASAATPREPSKPVALLRALTRWLAPLISLPASTHLPAGSPFVGDDCGHLPDECAISLREQAVRPSQRCAYDHSYACSYPAPLNRHASTGEKQAPGRGGGGYRAGLWAPLPCGPALPYPCRTIGRMIT